jgi:IS5 family transposase
MRPGKRRKLDKDNNPVDTLIDKEEKRKAGVRAKVEHPFRDFKRQFGLVKVALPGFEEKHTAAQDAVCTVPSC